MKTSTVLDRMNKLGINKNSKVYQLIKEYCKSADEGRRMVIRPCTINGTFSHCSYSNKTIELCDLLSKLKVRYELNNDAPRGGKLGNYVKILNIPIKRKKLTRNIVLTEGREKLLKDIVTNTRNVQERCFKLRRANFEVKRCYVPTYNKLFGKSLVNGELRIIVGRPKDHYVKEVYAVILK